MSDSSSVEVLSWMEFKIFKQYPAFGDMLEEIKLHGWRSAVGIGKDRAGNAYRWITAEQVLSLPERIYFAGISAKNR